MDNFLKTFKLITAVTIVILTALIITSCPLPLDDTLLAEVVDTVPPIINITSPDQNVKNYYGSTITITGTIVDYSDEKRTIAGSVTSVTYEEQYNKRINGTVTLGDGGSFTITLSTTDPEQLTGTQFIVITTTDWNGNITEYTVTLFDKTTGPALTITDHEIGDFNTYSHLLPAFTITGTVAMPAIYVKYAVEPGTGTAVPDTFITDFNTVQDQVFPGPPGSFRFSFDPAAASVSGPLTITIKSSDGDYKSSKDFVLADDDVKPTIASHTFPSNTTLTATLSEGVYTTADGVTGSNAVTETDFDLKLDGTPLTWNFSTSPTEGTELLEIAITSGLPSPADGTEQLTFAPKTGEIFDRVGNPANPATFLYSGYLYDQLAPTLISASQVDKNLIRIVFSENVAAGALDTGNYEYSTGSGTIDTAAYDGANHSAIILTFASDIVTANNLTISGNIEDEDGNSFAGVINHTIFDEFPPYIKDIRVRNNALDEVVGGLFNDSVSLYIDVEFSESLAGIAPVLKVTEGAGSSYTTDVVTIIGDIIRYQYDIQPGHFNSKLDVFSLIGSGLTDTSPGANVASSPFDITGPFAIDSAEIEIDAIAPVAPEVTGDAFTQNRKPTWSWLSVAGATKYRYGFTDGSGWIDSGSASLSYTPPVDDLIDGAYTLYVQAGDNADNWSALPSGSLTITIDNLPPTVFAGDDKTTGSLISLNSISGSDSDATAPEDTSASSDVSGIATYEWTQTGGGTEVTITNLGSGSLNPTVYVENDLEGPYTLQLKVTDNAGNFSTDDMTLTWDNGPKLTDVIFKDTGNNIGADTGDTIIFIFDEELNPASIEPTLDFDSSGGTTKTITGTLSTLISYVGSIPGWTADASTAELTMLEPALDTVVITLTSAESTTNPSGDFTPKTGIEDITLNTVGTHPAVTPVGTFDLTASIGTNKSTITASTTVDITITFPEPINTSSFIVGTNLILDNSGSDATILPSSLGWTGTTVYRERYTVTPGTDGTFIVTATLAEDIYGNVQNTPVSVTVTINVP
jgi:hypothetical protein